MQVLEENVRTETLNHWFHRYDQKKEELEEATRTSGVVDVIRGAVARALSDPTSLHTGVQAIISEQRHGPGKSSVTNRMRIEMLEQLKALLRRESIQRVIVCEATAEDLDGCLNKEDYLLAHWQAQWSGYKLRAWMEETLPKIETNEDAVRLLHLETERLRVPMEALLDPKRCHSFHGESPVLRSVLAYFSGSSAEPANGEDSEEICSTTDERNSVCEAGDTLNGQWLKRYTELAAWRESHPDSWPSMHSEDRAERSLAKWCSRQRQNRKKKGGLGKAKIAKMDSLSFDWNPMENWWEEKIGQLQTFIAENARFPTQQTEDSYERNLAMWCVKQRTAYRRNELEKGAVEALNAIGFRWEVFEERWLQMLERLKAFRRLHSDRWPSRYSEDGKERELANWCNHRRSEQRRGALTTDKKRALDELGFAWELKRGPKKKSRSLTSSSK